MDEFSVAQEPHPTDQLRQATQAIRNGDTTTAKRLVADVLKTTNENPDAWYLYAYLIEDPSKKREALGRALAINPQHARAQDMLTKLNDPLSDFLPDVRSAPPPQGMYQPPPIIVNVNQDNNNNQNVAAIAASGNARIGLASGQFVNQTALWVGFGCAAFLGIFGMAHLITGKIGGAVVYFFGGLLWIFVAVTITAVTAGLGACLMVPLHFYVAYTWSKKGATVIG